MTLSQKDSRVKMAAARNTLESLWWPPKTIWSLPGGCQILFYDTSDQMSPFKFPFQSVLNFQESQASILRMDNMEENQPSSSQEDDMIPLSKLRNRISTDAGSSDEDIPLADLRRTGSPISDFDDSDAGPEYKPGQCEVKRCR
ncbi:hypothetical protein PoB_002917500 [Plakobranchus ocellatus]|uniref:Uncharacterized protein n=1 Tax=Plakobranchus ocellatus TaxID=259542 RepID=A0AAV4A758_9GAST|nr:hypothetical protein PoB_002917500 [Plakobranchus ocellatus]